MTLRISIGILLCILSLSASRAQLTKRDSIRLKQLLEGQEEIKINPEAVKNIRFNFAPKVEDMKGKPMMSEDKPWMKFDQSLPKNFNDTTRWQKPKYHRMLPYTVYTRWNEDPMAGRYVVLKEDTMTFKLDLEYLKQYIPQNQPLVSFDTDKFLYENFTKRGRTIRRNRKRAKAWRTYQEYVPTKEDSLLFHKNKIYRKDEAEEGSEVIPVQRLATEEHRGENGKDD